MLRINPVGGGLGNDMYQYSFCRSVAEKLGGSYSTFSQWAGYLNIYKNKILFPYNIKFNMDNEFYPVKFFKYLTSGGKIIDF